VKIDLLGLGALALLHRALELLQKHKQIELNLAHLKPDDPEVYDMMCRADTVGVFQIESRAQMNCLPRLRPRCFYDLVIEVALIRPGPIQGKMVHPFLRRRQGREAVTYPHPSLKPILQRTLGVPLFQEQGMKIAVAAAGFTPSQADELRRAMGHRRSRQRMAALARRLIEGMARRGISREAAQRIFDQLAAFADFGFAESHAASFALLVYATAWMKQKHPEVYVASILNAQPMGFYAPATLVNDARRHGVRFRPIDVQESEYDCTLEQNGKGLEVRLGLRFVHGIGEELRDRILQERARQRFRSPEDFGVRCQLPTRVLERLARIGAFGSFGQQRRAALWQVQAAARAIPGPLAARRPREPKVDLQAMTVQEELREDYRYAGLSISRQPLELWRPRLTARGVLRAGELTEVDSGKRVAVAGLVICRQRPPTAGGMCFVTLEDETGLANIVVTPQHFATYRREVRLAPFLLVHGTVERAEGVTNVRGQRFFELSAASLEGKFESHDFR
jgi:error-prone DNA polymerase